MTVDDSYVGREVICVKCHQRLRVPQAPADAGAVVRAEVPRSSMGSDALPEAAGVGHRLPHRASLVLVLGLLGFIPCCGFVGAIAWVFGVSDIKKMHSGEMDPSGEGVTNVGKILGMLAALLWVIEVIVFLGFQLSPYSHRGF